MSQDNAIPNNVSHLSAAERPTPRPPYRPRNEGMAVSADYHRPQPGKFVAKGHDAQLQDAQYGKFPVLVTLTDGAEFWGTVSKRDKFTITFKYLAGRFLGLEEIVYKHAIQSLLLDRDNAVFKKKAD